MNEQHTSSLWKHPKNTNNDRIPIGLANTFPLPCVEKPEQTFQLTLYWHVFRSFFFKGSIAAGGGGGQRSENLIIFQSFALAMQ